MTSTIISVTEITQKLTDLMFDLKAQRILQKTLSLQNYHPEIFIDGQGLITNRHWMIFIAPKIYKELPKHISRNGGPNIPLHCPTVYRLFENKIVDTGMGALPRIPPMRMLYDDLMTISTKEVEWVLIPSYFENDQRNKIYTYTAEISTGRRIKYEIYRKEYMDKIFSFMKTKTHPEFTTKHSGKFLDPVVIINSHATAIIMPTKKPEHKRLSL